MKLEVSSPRKGKKKGGSVRAPARREERNDGLPIFVGEDDLKRNRKKRRGKAGFDARKAALSWLEMGIQPVPLYPKSKRPSGGKGWTTLKVSEDTIDNFFKPDDNIGGLWGEPSGWIVDVDLDWDEAIDFASHFLPETFTYGRRTRPDSHYLFRCKGAEGYKRILKSGEVIVEIRSTGSQSVLPPSMHPDGERYQIDHNAPFAAITKRELERSVDIIAAGALLLRYFPDKGSRHDYIHSLCGALLWSGWGEQEVRRFMECFLACIYDEESRDRQTTVESTIQHFKKGDRIQGWRTLSQWIEGPILQTLKKWLTPSKRFQTPPKLSPGEIEVEIPPFDTALLEVPGLVGEVAAWAGKRSYLKQPSFDLAVGLMSTALATCNNFVVQGWSTPLQPYFMLLAPTAAGKGSALDSVFQFAVQAGLGEYVFQGFQSYYALLDRLGETPSLACWIWDEAARRLKATRNPSSLDYQIVTWLLSLYGRANTQVPGFPGRKIEIPVLDRPWLAIFAGAQPSQLIESVTVSDLAMGLLNRFVLFDSGDGTPEANIYRSEVFPSSIKKTIKTMKELDPRKVPMEIGFESASVWAMFRDFDEEARKHAAEEGDNEIWGRANQNALILAGLVAVGINPKRPLISSRVAAWATALIRWEISCWTARIGESASRSFREGASKQVERYIRNPRKFAHRANGNLKEMMERGLMPASMLLRLCRHLGKRELSEILDQLVDAELINCGEEEGIEVYWPNR